MTRMKPMDWTLLLALLPAFLVVFAVSARHIATSRLDQAGFYLAPPATDADWPEVAGFWATIPDAGADDIRVGDRLLRMGDIDMRGRGLHLEFLMDAAELGGDGAANPVLIQQRRRRDTLDHVDIQQKIETPYRSCR